MDPLYTVLCNIKYSVEKTWLYSCWGPEKAAGYEDARRSRDFQCVPFCGVSAVT